MELIRESDYRETMEQTVLPYLESVRREGTFESFDGAPIHWYGYRAPEPSRTVAILHGYTESARKYAEMIWYFLRDGCNVYICDQRGHGRSFRHVEDLTLTHVERFEDYVRDFACFVEQVVPHDLPLRLYAHSMGGAVASLYLEGHDGVFPKAVLSSPMIAPDRGGMPLFLSKAMCRLFILAGRSRARIFLAGPFQGPEPFEESCATSRPRFDLYQAYRVATPTHQNCAPTYRWTLESLRVAKQILRKGGPEGIGADVLLCAAEMDNMVLPGPQDAFIARVPRGRKKSYRARHELFNSTDDVMAEYVSDVLEHLR